MDTSQKIRERLPAIMTVLGGMILNCVAGNLNNWGALFPYVYSNLSSFDPQVTSTSVYNAQPFSFLAENIGVMSAPYISRLLGIRACLFLGGIMMAGGYLLCSVIQNVHLLVLSYAFSVGIGSGMVSITCLWPCWEYFPNSKGKITGLILGGYSCASMVFSLVFTFLVNPNNVPPTRHSNEVNFGPLVNQNVPLAFLWVGTIFALMTCLGVALIQPRSKNTQIGTASNKSISTLKILKSENFWGLFGVGYTCFVFWYFIGGCYKSFGLMHISDDHLLSYIGCLANIAGTLGGWFWSSLLDYFPFKKVMTLTMTYQLVACCLVYYFVQSPALYGGLIVTLFFSTACNYPAMAVETGHVFSSLSSQVWPLVFVGISLASVTTIFLQMLAKSLGFLYVFMGMACVILISILLIWRLNEKCKLSIQQDNDVLIEPFLNTV